MCCILVFLFFGLISAVGFYALGAGRWNARRSMRVADWPTTPGTITQISVDEKSDGDGSTYKVNVQYTYTVDGVAHEGSRLAFGYDESNDREAHDEIYQKLKDARMVDVRYNPSNPSESCLSFGIHRSIQMTLAFGVMWLAFTSGFALIFWLYFRSDYVLLNNLSIPVGLP